MIYAARYSAWGLYGDDDHLGTLNRLEDDLVAKTAREEIQTGTRYIHLYSGTRISSLMYIRVSLNWPLDAQSKPGFGRQAFHKNVYQKAPRIVNDDVWTLNTQSSSQCKCKPS